MGRLCVIAVFCILVCTRFGIDARSAPPGCVNCYSFYYKQFSAELILNSKFEDLIDVKGAVMSSPFEVAYMLANLNSQTWNVSTNGLEETLMVPPNKLTAQYADLSAKLEKIGVQTKRALFAGSKVDIPQVAKDLKIDVLNADFQDFKSARSVLNSWVTANTAGKLNNHLIPKGTLGPVFYPFTTGMYIHTNYYQTKLPGKWESVGKKKFSDGHLVEFLEPKSRYPIREAPKYTAIGIPLKENETFAVFVLPTGPELRQFMREDLSDFMKDGPRDWPISQELRKVQLPKLNLTVLNSYYSSFIKFGLNKTFCPSDAFTIPPTSPNTTGNSPEEPNYFSSPIVQANHIELTENYLEISSATGASVNSKDELRELLKGHSYADTSSDKTSSNKTTATAKPNESSDTKTIRFDKPFFWYLYDKELGPFQFGFVESLERYNEDKDGPSDLSWLGDVRTVDLWTCPQLRNIRPPPLSNP